MCLICNRASLAVKHEVRSMFEANAVKAAADIGSAMSHNALMWRQYELVDHFGGDLNEAVGEGKKALESLDAARARYAENVFVAREYGLDPDVKAYLEKLEIPADRVGLKGRDAEWEKTLAVLKQDHLEGLFGRMHKQVQEISDELKAAVDELSQGKFPLARFIPVMDKFHELLLFGHSASRAYSMTSSEV